MQLVKISKIRANKNNPRVIKDERFMTLLESIKSFPEMLYKRGLVVESNDDSGYTVLGGNQRLRALNHFFKISKEDLLSDLQFKENKDFILDFHEKKEIPIIVCDDWTLEQKREFIVRDNIDFGQWDFDKLSTEYEMDELDDWGLERIDGIENETFENGESSKTENLIKSYSMYHVLISIPIQKVEKLLPVLNELEKIEGLEIERQAN
jgi:hypothetical protein